MRVIINERAVYLIFEHDPTNIRTSADELAQLAHGVEDDDRMFKLLIRAAVDLERRMKVKQDGPAGSYAEKQPE